MTSLLVVSSLLSPIAAVQVLSGASGAPPLAAAAAAASRRCLSPVLQFGGLPKLELPKLELPTDLPKLELPTGLPNPLGSPDAHHTVPLGSPDAHHTALASLRTVRPECSNTKGSTNR